MGRTKRLRERKRNDVSSLKHIPTICLYNYLTQIGWKNHSKLICKEFSTTGRGLCSKNAIFAGDVLIKLPVDAMITLATIENDDDFGDWTNEFELFSNVVPFQSLLALYILYQKHLNSNSSGIKLYIDSLPKAFSTPYFCQSDELYFLPEEILMHTVEQNKKIRDSYNVFVTAFGGKVCLCCGKPFLPDIFTLVDFKWAYFAVNSRSVFLNADEIKSFIKGDSFCKKILSDKPDMALAPFLDMFNHSDIASTIPQIVNENNGLSFQLITNVSYKPHEQIFISYGNLTNVKLLTEYGFSLERNLHNYFEISLVDIEGLIKSDPRFKGMNIHSNKFKFVRDHNLNDQMFIHTVDGLSHNLQVTLYVIFKEASHFTNVLSQTAFGTNIAFEDSVQTEAQLLILYKIKEYQTFIEGFSKLKDLSLSAQATLQYLRHSVSYLQSCIHKLS